MGGKNVMCEYKRKVNGNQLKVSENVRQNRHVAEVAMHVLAQSYKRRLNAMVSRNPFALQLVIS